MKLPFTHELLNGKGEPARITFRKAVPEDIDAIMLLQERMYDALPDKDLCRVSPRKIFEAQLAEDVFFAAVSADDGRLAAISILVPNDPDNPRNYGNYLRYDREQMAKTVGFDLTIVDPDFRGYGLQRIFNKLRISAALKLGATEGLVTISPNNSYSLRNFLILNFEIVEERELYGGKSRYILRKELKKHKAD